jgi:hypothetical protein
MSPLVTRPPCRSRRHSGSTPLLGGERADGGAVHRMVLAAARRLRRAGAGAGRRAWRRAAQPSAFRLSSARRRGAPPSSIWPSKRAGLDRLAVLRDDLAEHAGGRRRHFERDLVGFELDQRLVAFTAVAGLLEPFADGRFADGFAEGRYADFGRHLRRYLGTRPSGAPGDECREARRILVRLRRPRRGTLGAARDASTSGPSPSRRRPGGRHSARASTFAGLLQHPFEIGLDEGPGAHVLGLFLAPDDIGLLEARQLGLTAPSAGTDRAARRA